MRAGGIQSIVDIPGQLAQRIAGVRDSLDDQALVEPFLDSREFADF